MLLNKSNIHIIPATAINSLKWDEKIRSEKNGLIYSTTRYLNELTDNWCGLVINDYEIIAAIPFRKKIFIPYCYSPAFIQQLGIIGNFTKEDGVDIIRTIKKKYKYGSLQFNFQNCSQLFLGNNIKKTNYVLPLNKPFTLIANDFRKDLKVSLQKCKYQLFEYIKTTNFEIAIQFYQNQNIQKIKNIRNNEYQNLLQYCKTINKKSDGCFTRTIVDKDNKILALALILKDEKRLYNIANAVTQEGRGLHANHFLISKIIEEFAEQELLFDFEGSMLPGVKEFYASFGSKKEFYSTHQYNNLPFPLSYFN